jgi:protein-tyrosine kinase
MERLKRALDLAGIERERRLGLQRENASEADRPPEASRHEVLFSQTRELITDPVHLRKNGVMAADVSGVVGPSFKMLRTQVLQRMQARGWNTLAVVSPTPGDGKTFTAINLAIAVAGDTNYTALLVDLDLLRPSIHHRFGFEPECGIEQCLLGDVPLSDVLVHPQGYPKLLVAPGKNPVRSSSELLGSERARQVIREMKERHTDRVVIFDLPPVLGADDALTFAPQVDTALLVVGAERTHREHLLRCLEILCNVAVLGTVLNGSRMEPKLAY